MKELSLKEIQKIEFDILTYFADFCKKNSLRFYLCGGTLLGAVRHHGFIPWDDDLDVCMPRPDYDKLMKLYGEEVSNIRLFSWERRNMTAPFAKLKRIDTRISCRTSNSDSDIDTNLWIDIFPFDGLPESAAEQRWIYRRAYIYRQFLALCLSRSGTGRTFVRKEIKNIIRPFARLVGAKRFNAWLDSFARQIPYGATPYVGSIAWGLHGFPGEVMQIDMFEKGTLVEFCGATMPTFSCWENYLSNCYGDYMQLPDEKDRQTHQYKAYLLD